MLARIARIVVYAFLTVVAVGFCADLVSPGFSLPGDFEAALLGLPASVLLLLTLYCQAKRSK